MATYFGMNPPFIGGPQNVLSRQEDDQIIKNDLMQLILTVPGERIHRSDFGTPLRSFVFEQNTLADLEILRVQLDDAIRVFEPRVNIETLHLAQDVDGHTIKLFLVVTLVKDPKRQITIERFFSSPSDSTR